MNKPVTHFIDPLHAENIQRFHTYPHLHEQNVVDHSLRVLRILLGIWPEVPKHVMVHCVVHDAGEIGSGDVPMYAKHNNPELKKQIDKIENDTHLRMCYRWYFPHPQELTEFEKFMFKLAESIELFERGWYEYNLGNMYAKHIIRTHRDFILQKCDELLKREDVPENANVTRIQLRASGYFLNRDKVEKRVYEEGVI